MRVHAAPAGTSGPRVAGPPARDRAALEDPGARRACRLREAQRDVAAAANNLLLGTCAERERLKAAFAADWGLALQLLAPIAEELTPARGVTVKKR